MNSIFVCVFSKFSVLTDSMIKELGPDWDQRRVERWYRNRRNQNALPKVAKFCETFWRFTFYTVIYIYACWVMNKSSWFWDNVECWVGFPMQELEPTTKCE